jgi:hypothetical protein
LSIDAAIATIHPSAVLRARSSQDREQALDGLIADLQVVAKAMKKAN